MIITTNILKELQNISKKQVKMSDDINKIKLTLRKRELDSDILGDLSYYETFPIESDDDLLKLEEKVANSSFAVALVSFENIYLIDL